MYPGLFTRGTKSSKVDAKDEYLNIPPLRSPQLLMKAYFVIGKWIMQPKATKMELDKMRFDIISYVAQPKFGAEVVKTFMTLLSLSEPSGKMKDCDIWKCAKMKSTSLQVEVQDEAKVEDDVIEIKNGHSRIMPH